MTKAWEIKKDAVRLLEDDIPAIYIRQFDFDSAQTFVKDFNTLESDGSLDSIFVYVSSYGGEIFPLLMMMEAIHSSKKEVHMVGMGGVFSAGADIVAAGPKGNRWLGANSYMHIHHARGFLAGPINELEQQVGDMKQLEDHLMKMVVKNCSLNMKEFKRLLKEKNGEWRLTADEALEYGFIDHIGIPVLKKYETWEYEV